MFIQKLLNGHKADAIQKLGFLSDEKSMAPSSAIPTESGKIWLIFHLRRRLPFYDVVEEFREGLGMTKMPELDTIRDNIIVANFAFPKPISHLYPQPQTRGDNHYFQLINHTDVPIKVVCDGAVGDHVNGLKFCADVEPRSSYQHIATNFTGPFPLAASLWSIWMVGWGPLIIGSGVETWKFSSSCCPTH